MDMEIKKELMIQDIMDKCNVDSDTAETLFDCEVEDYAEKNKIEDMEAAEALYLLDDSREEKAEKPRRVYNNVDRCELEMLQGAFITAVETMEKDDRVCLDAVKIENGKLICLGFILDDEGLFLNYEG